MSGETSTVPAATRSTRAEQRRRLAYLVPVLAFAALVLALAWGLTRDPQLLPSALIGQPVPEFSLPPVQGRTLGLSSADLRGEVSLVNVFASWCVPCRVENPLLLRLAAERVVPIHGINYKDSPDEAARWLETYGDPFTRTGADRDGRVAIDWGVYGLPETFVISAEGQIVHRHIGALTERDLRESILPLVERLRRTSAGASR